MSTGMDTMPNEIVADAMERAMLVLCFSLERVLAEDAVEVLLEPDDLAPHVALTLETLEHVPHPEVHRMCFCQLIPRERHRYRCSRQCARRVRRVQGFAADIHVAVDEDLPGALRDIPLHGNHIRMLLHHIS